MSRKISDYEKEAKRLTKSISIPVNSLALLHDLEGILELSNTNSLSDLSEEKKTIAQVYFHYLTIHLYGQFYDISSRNVYRRLSDHYRSDNNE